jgi:hypothetical protein
MSVVWLIGKIAFYTFILNVLFRQTYNFIFVLAKRPTVWIGVVALLGVANMALAYALSWDPRLVGAATLTTIILNIPPSGGVGPEPDRRRSRSRVRAGYRRNRGLHENLRPGQANGVPSEQRQFFATARDQERARRPK